MRSMSRRRRAEQQQRLVDGFRRIEDDRIAVARSHDYEPDPDHTATNGDPDCRVCGQPKRYHR